MPLFKITTTTISYLDIPNDDEFFEDAIDAETGEVDLASLKDLLEESITDPHDDFDRIADSQDTVVVKLSEKEAKAFKASA